MEVTAAEFVSGMIAMSFIVVAVFFFRFWTQTKDQLFSAFALAFLLLALSQALTTLLDKPFEEQSWIMLLRLGAFLLLIAAILRKNIRS